MIDLAFGDADHHLRELAKAGGLGLSRAAAGGCGNGQPRRPASWRLQACEAGGSRAAIAG